MLCRLPETTGLCRQALDPDDLVNKEAGRDDVLGVDLTQLRNLVHGGYRLFAGRGHNGAEVAGRHAVHQVAPAVAALGLDQRDITVDGMLQYVILSIAFAAFLALGQLGAKTGRREEGANARARRPDALSQIACGTSSNSSLPLR